MKDFYSDTAAYVAAWARLWSMVWSATSGVLLVLSAIVWDLGFALGGAVALVFTVAHVWIGFFYLANPEWKDTDTDG
jgi:hypothetical protein